MIWGEKMLVEFIVGIIGDTLYEKIKGFLVDKSAYKKMMDDLTAEVHDFEMRNDGTMIVSDVFTSYLNNFKVINKIIESILEPNVEDSFKTDLVKGFTSGFEAYCQRNEKEFKIAERYLIVDLLELVYTTVDKYAKESLGKEEKYILYAIFQTRKSFERSLLELRELNEEQIKTIQTMSDELQTIRSEIYGEELLLQLNEQWFENQNRIAISNMGDRYLPELDIPLRINESLDVIDRSSRFRKRFLSFVDETLTEINHISIKEVKDETKKITDLVLSIPFYGNEFFDFDLITECASEIVNIVQSEIDELEQKDSTNDINNQIYRLNKAMNYAYDLIDYMKSDELRLFNNPFLLIKGKAGVGKSHLIADTVNRRMLNGKKAILLLGQQFNSDEEPWKQIKNHLDINYTVDEILDTLNEIGRMQNSRLIIYIDALNEGGGKSLWSNYFSGIIERIKTYDYLGLVCSIRSTYYSVVFRGNRNLTDKFIQIEHIGFSEVEFQAQEKFFKHYGIKSPDIPLLNFEFGNPLFLLMYCKVVSDTEYNSNLLSMTDVYSHYAKMVNSKLARRYDFYEGVNFTDKLFKKIVEIKIETERLSSRIDLDSLFEVVFLLCEKFRIQGNIIEGLLSEGVLTKAIDYRGEEYFYITYEKFEDYLVARHLIDKCSVEEINDFLCEGERLKFLDGVIDSLAIQAPEQIDSEIYEILPKFSESHSVRKAFVNSLYWRSENSLNESVVDYINKVILGYVSTFDLFFDTAILLASRPNHIINGRQTHNMLKSLEMPDRDADFIPLFDKLYQSPSSSLRRILNWASSPSDKKDICDAVIENIAIVIAWFAISPNRVLRDTSTKAIVNLLVDRDDMILRFLREFEGVDDPYVLERIYAIAYGCTVNGLTKDSISNLANYTYKMVFDKEDVFPHILLRDYARNIIEYALYIGCSLNFDRKKIEPPYNSTFPEIPSDENIESYDIDNEDPDFKDYYYSQSSILRSMRVEYTRDGQPGWYGDFGRYTFQWYFHDWKQLKSNDLMNIAVKMIFDMGYDVEKHGEYDRNLSYISGSRPLKERIGKKYQWIALHTLAALVADNYPMTAPWSGSQEEELVYCKGSYEPHIRDVDPTVYSNYTFADKENDSSKYRCSFEGDISQWILSNDLPEIDSFIKHEFSNRNWILLSGSFNFNEPKRLGVRRYDIPHKNIWINVRSYMVSETEYENVLEQLKHVDLFDALPDYARHSYLFNKEYYYSEAHSYFKRDYYGCDTWSELKSFRFPQLSGSVMMPVEHFSREGGNDCSFEEGISWWKPIDEIVTSLNLKYGDHNSALYGEDDSLICFDSAEIFDESIGFMFCEEQMKRFLEDNSLRVFFVITGRKGMIGGRHVDRYSLNDFSGIYTYDNGQIRGSLNSKIY